MKRSIREMTEVEQVMTNFDWASAASVDDVAQLYRAILGRRAEPDVLKKYQPRPFIEVVSGLATSAEMRERVLAAIVQGEHLPHERMAADELIALEHWVIERFGTAHVSLPTAGAVLTLIGRWMAHPNLVEALHAAHGDLHAAGLERILPRPEPTTPAEDMAAAAPPDAVWDAPATPEDLAQLYWAFLGRPIDPSAIESYRPRPFREVVQGLASSKEIHDRVLMALVEGQELPHAAMPAPDLAALGPWWQARLRPNDGAEGRAPGEQAEAQTVAGLLANLFAQPEVAAALQKAHGALFDEVLLRLRAAAPQQAADDSSQVAPAAAGGDAPVPVETPAEEAAEAPVDWEALVTVDDLSQLYLAFLGRPADAAALDGHRPRGLREVIRGFATSQEIDQRVLHALVQQRDLPHETLSVDALVALEGWLVNRLALPGLPAAAQAASGSAAGLLARLYARTEVAGMLLDAHGSLFTEALSQLQLRLRAGRSRFKGRIEFANREVISGFLVDVAGAVERPQVELRCQGRLVASASTGNIRTDIQQHVGGDGTAGFRAAWDPSQLPAGDAVLTLHAAGSGVQVGAPYRFANDFFDQLSVAQRLAKEFDEIKRRLDALAGLVPQAASFSAFPLEHYDLYRRSHRVAPAPAAPASALPTRFTVLVDAAQANGQALRVTADSLREQAGDVLWKLCVVGDAPEVTEAAALLSASLPSVQCLADWSATLPLVQSLGGDASRWVVLLQAGEVLDASTLAWLHAARQGSSAVGLYWDEDRVEQRTGRLPGREPRHVDPVLRSRFDPHSLLELNGVGQSFAVRADALSAAVALLAAHPSADAAGAHPLSLAERERLVWAVLRQGEWLHLPQFLLTRTELALRPGEPVGPERWIARASLEALVPLLPAQWQRRRWQRVSDPIAPGIPKSLLRWEPNHPQAVLSILIPTRDQGELLRHCVESLQLMAALPQTLDIIVADNGSRDEKTLSYLETGRKSGCFRVIRVDEPFNWSRLNNIMAKQAKGKYLLFLNDDTRMLTRDWDQILRGLLEQNQVGAIGARLLYEDLTIQHAGIVYGTEGFFAHDGVGRSVDDATALFNTQLTHAVTAVTGAFLACRSEVFQQTGPFDEDALGVTFNDVDWCMRVRQRGLDIVYAPALSLIHLESKSRGLDYQSQTKQVRAETEKAVLLARMVPNMPQEDMFRSPRWSNWLHRSQGLR